MIAGILAFLRELIFFEGENSRKRFSYRELIPYLRYVRPIWHWGALGLVAGIMGSAFKMIVPYSPKIFIDNIALGSSDLPIAQSLPATLPAFIIDMIAFFTTTLPGLITLLLIAGVGSVIAALLKQYALVTFSEEYTFQVQSTLYSHVLAFSPAFFRNQKTGYLIGRMNADTQMMQYVFSSVIIQMVINIFTCIIVLGILLSLNAALVLILILFSPVFILINVFFVRRIRALIIEGRERDAYIYSDLQEVLSGIDVIKTHSAEAREYQRIISTVRNAIANRIKREVYSSLSNQAILIAQGIALVVVFWFGGQDVLAGRMSIGDFVAFSTYITLFGTTITGLISIPQQLQPALVSASRISELLALEPESALEDQSVRIKHPGRVTGHIRFSNVSFAYIPGTPVISGITLDIPPGTITAIIGRTGSGKTTLMNLLLRFYECEEGRILLDGTDINHLDPRWLREQIAVVSQDMFLFHATVAENIRYSRPSASLDEVRTAASHAGIDQDIMAMPAGYDTVVGDRGVKISAGQRQRISIARAFLKDAPILILDEPTSHLDRETEQQLEGVLRSLSEERTTIMITHRHTLLSIADDVYLLEDGRVRPAAFGTGQLDDPAGRSG